MIIVVASQVDDAAGILVDEWGAEEATLLTPLDLSRSGWSVVVPPDGDSYAVAGGQPVAEAAVTGVVTALPCVFPAELVQIDPADRRYVAAEMTALLRCWLGLLRCPRLNPPTDGCLSGPSWSTERWLLVAARAGLPVAPIRRWVGGRDATPGAAAPHEARVTVVGSTVVGPADAELVDAAQRLAAAAGVHLLSVGFRRIEEVWRIAGASPFADLFDPGVRSAVRRYFDSAGQGEGRT